MYKLYYGDFQDYKPSDIDVIITDPPYPNYLADEYLYYDGMLNFLQSYKCRQFIFWTVTEEFPLSFTAKHTWDKITGTYARYEHLYERNGDKKERVFKYQKYNNWVDAQFYRDIKVDHPSQKNLAMLKIIIADYTSPSDTIYDPFMGSGTTGVAAVQMGRSFIGCEIAQKYYSIAEKRIKDAALQPLLFTPSTNPDKPDDAHRIG